MSPVHGQFLISGVNDTWNEFQHFSKGKHKSPADWRKARDILRCECEDHLARGGTPSKPSSLSTRFERHMAALIRWSDLPSMQERSHAVS